MAARGLVAASATAQSGVAMHAIRSATTRMAEELMVQDGWPPDLVLFFGAGDDLGSNQVGSLVQGFLTAAGQGGGSALVVGATHPALGAAGIIGDLEATRDAPGVTMLGIKFPPKTNLSVFVADGASLPDLHDVTAEKARRVAQASTEILSKAGSGPATPPPPLSSSLSGSWAEWATRPAGASADLLLFGQLDGGGDATQAALDLHALMARLDLVLPHAQRAGGVLTPGSILHLNGARLPADDCHLLGVVVDGADSGVCLDSLVCQGPGPVEARERTITASESGYILELDSVPIAELVEDLREMSLRAVDGSLFASLRTSGAADDAAGAPVIRPVAMIDKGVMTPTGFIMLGATPESMVAEGCKLRFHALTTESAMAELETQLQGHADHCRRDGRPLPAAALVSSCIGRAQLHAEDEDAEVELIQKLLKSADQPTPLPICGFFASGEFGGRGPHMHTFATTMALFSSRP